MLGCVELVITDEIRQLIRRALEEDIGSGDATTLAVVPPELPVQARMVARERLVVAGLALSEAVFREVSIEIEVRRLAEDGRVAEPGSGLIEIRGPARPILSAERLALNFLQRLSGIATLTAEFVREVKGTHARILDTRKTTPGLRCLEKYAVRCGGGKNHRTGLFDMILIKDNHLAALREAGPNPIAAAVARARAEYPGLEVEVEADNLLQVQQALEAGADIVLLDNMSTDQLRAAAKLARGRARTEASGGVTLENVRAIAETGVDLISVGALTHSARAVDIGLDFFQPLS